MDFGRIGKTGVVAAVAGAAIVAGAALPANAKLIEPQGRAQSFDTGSLGMHVNDLFAFDGPFGSIRLWDNGVRWDQINTAPGVYDWTKLDAAVERAESLGADRIMYVLGSTPAWASSGKEIPNYLHAEGANYPPRNDRDWQDWVEAVTDRYAGRITDYQIWNEANFSSFWTGDERRLTNLTVQAAKIIRRNDPAAKVVTSSVVVRVGKKTSKQSAHPNSKSFIYNHLKQLKPNRKLIDRIGVHLYPWKSAGPGDGSPEVRQEAIDDLATVARKLGFKQPFIDTEMGYGNRRDNGWRHKTYSQKTTASWLIQTYLQSGANRVVQTYWYGWDNHVLGMDLTALDGRVLPGGRAYERLMGWVGDNSKIACSFERDNKQYTVCKLSGGAEPGYVVWAKRNKRIDVGSSRAFTSAMGVTGTSSKKLRIGPEPKYLAAD